MKRLLIAFLSAFLLWGMLLNPHKIQAAERYPVKPITCIVPVEAGADGDIAFRPLGEKASTILGKPVVIVNKPGAGQTIGYLETHSAKPDGYTICWTSSTIVTSKLLGIIRYDHRDFTPLCRLYTAYPVIIASTKTQRPFKTIQEVILFAKSHPGEISLATTATGGPLWIATHVFQQATGLNFNIIPQEGSAGFVITQVVGGHTDLGVTFFPTAKPQVEAGNIRVLAVIGDERFSDKYDYIPTLKEIGYPVSYPSFATMLGPPNMPKPITEKLVQTFELAIKDPAVQKFWLSRYYFPSFLPPDQLMKFCDQQKEVYRAVLDKAKLLKEK